jgi:uncharacterized delta-60 repeat protein
MKPSRGPAAAAVALITVALGTASALGSGPGELDPTFGGDGTVAADFGGTWSATGGVTDSAGRAVVAGATAPGHDGKFKDFSVARFTADGVPDPDFGGGDGVVTTPFEAIGDELTSNAVAVTVDGEGRILAGGYAGYFPGDEDTFARFAFARYLPDGELDQSFGHGGTLMRNVDVGNSTVDIVHTLRLDSHGRILALGEAYNRDGGSPIPIAMRMAADGTLDRSFGDRGIALARGTSLEVSDANVGPNGAITFSGSTAYEHFGLVRMHRDGRLDRSFGRGGLRVLFKDDAGSASAVAVDRKHRVITAGTIERHHAHHMAVVRLTPSGELDRSFGHGGKLRVPLPGEQSAASILSLPHGILLGGADGRGSALSPLLVVLHRNGRLDRSFGEGGVLEPDFGPGPAEVDAFGPSYDGEIYAAGSGLDRGNVVELELARFRP